MEHTVNYTALTKYILSLILTITTISCFCQVEQNKFADSVIIYIGFYSGGTTADLRWNSDAVDTMKTVIKTKLSKNYLDTLNFLIEQIKPHRHHQQKVGPSNYACVFQNGRKHKIAIVPNCCIIDLTTKEQYDFLKTDYIAIFNRFVNFNYR